MHGYQIWTGVDEQEQRNSSDPVFDSLDFLIEHYRKSPGSLPVLLGEVCRHYFLTVKDGIRSSLEYWEVSRDSLLTDTLIHTGCHANVSRGKLSSQVVAVKVMKNNDSFSFEMEFAALRELRHPRILQLLGILTNFPSGSSSLVTELMEGSLLSYIKNCEDFDYYNLANQIAEGMRFLESQNYVHRNLAARNILLSGNHPPTCKIADFKRARRVHEGVYNRTGTDGIASRWAAPEVIVRGQYSFASDVWSFGIVLMEMAMKGGEPYAELTNRQVLEKVPKGYRMLQPLGCSVKLYALMSNCWAERPPDRPSFEAVCLRLKSLCIGVNNATAPHNFLPVDEELNLPSDQKRNVDLQVVESYEDVQSEILPHTSVTSLSSLEMLGTVPWAVNAGENDCCWYYHNISSSDTERLLMLSINGVGSFLVRNAEGQSSKYVIAFRDEKGIHQVPIQENGSSGYQIPNDYDVIDYHDDPTFGDLNSLVSFYQRENSPLRLRSPCKHIYLTENDGSPPELAYWDVARDKLSTGDLLGSGEFAEVYRGTLMGEAVAIKTMKMSYTSTQHQLFLKEFNVMKGLSHPRLLSLSAVCTDEGSISFVMEIMKESLLDFLRRRDAFEVKTVTIQIADGMCYLEKKRCIHRDLAARNVLIANGYPITCKIADFGLARFVPTGIYQTAGNGPIPIKWTAPEATLYGQFSSMSDVWSFGILLMEIITNGRVPYPGMSNEEVVREVEGGYRMAKPNQCSEGLYDLMAECWSSDPNERPSFESIRCHLTQENVCSFPVIPSQSTADVFQASDGLRRDTCPNDASGNHAVAHTDYENCVTDSELEVGYDSPDDEVCDYADPMYEYRSSAIPCSASADRSTPRRPPSLVKSFSSQDTELHDNPAYECRDICLGRDFSLHDPIVDSRCVRSTSTGHRQTTTLRRLASCIAACLLRCFSQDNASTDGTFYDTSSEHYRRRDKYVGHVAIVPPIRNQNAGSSSCAETSSANDNIGDVSGRSGGNQRRLYPLVEAVVPYAEVSVSREDHSSVGHNFMSFIPSTNPSSSESTVYYRRDQCACLETTTTSEVEESGNGQQQSTECAYDYENTALVRPCSRICSHITVEETRGREATAQVHALDHVARLSTSLSEPPFDSEDKASTCHNNGYTSSVEDHLASGVGDGTETFCPTIH